MTIMGRIGRIGRMAALMMASAVAGIDRELAPASAKFMRVVDSSAPADPKPETRVVVSESLLYDLDKARGKDRMSFSERINQFRSRVITFVMPDDNGRPVTCKVDPRTIRVDGPHVYGMVHIHLEAEHVLKSAGHPPEPVAPPVQMPPAG